MLASTLEATSTTQLEASTITSSSFPTRPPSTLTLASPASDSRLQTPQTENFKERQRQHHCMGIDTFWKSNITIN